MTLAGFFTGSRGSTGPIWHGGRTGDLLAKTRAATGRQAPIRLSMPWARGLGFISNTPCSALRAWGVAFID